MKSCCKCDKQVLSGHIICSECKDSGLPLRYYIDQLAEEIVLDHPEMCSFCIRESCDTQQSGLTCRHNVKQFLLQRKNAYAETLKAEMAAHKEHYAFLDNLRESGTIDFSTIQERFIGVFPQLTIHQAGAILSTWEDIRYFNKQEDKYVQL